MTKPWRDRVNVVNTRCTGESRAFRQPAPSSPHFLLFHRLSYFFILATSSPPYFWSFTHSSPASGSRSMGDLTESSTLRASPTRQPPVREDCWTEEATRTLVEAWGRRYVELNRGNLRQKDWQEVADVVNVHHGHTKKFRRTDVQCKNRIDTIKNKYKTEKAKISESSGTLTSSWPFFPCMDYLIGSNFSKHQNKSPMEMDQYAPLLSLPSPPMGVPFSYRSSPSSTMVTPVILPQRRSMSPPPTDESYFKRNFSAIAAAAAAADDDDGEFEGAEAEGSEGRDFEAEEKGYEGMGRLAKAIERFG
ncbi:uncharacterized protein [Henckelia pumila]|uniref:uncharacterized protein n=1 Tax=Henckelia pumila TaxID=405737 RepID=UPI003C6DB93B